MSLPDKFTVRIKDFEGFNHTVKRNEEGRFDVKWSRGFFEKLMSTDRGRGMIMFKQRDVGENVMQAWVDCGDWVICDAPAKPTLTAEQQRTLADFKDRHAQLAQSIKLSEQDIEHKQRLISNYKGQQEDLMQKINEMEDV